MSKNAKRERSHSPYNDKKYHKKRYSAPSELNRSSNYNTEKDYSSSKSNIDIFKVFEKYKHELNKLLNGKERYVKNLEDFWNFVRKYDSIQKRTNKVIDSSSINKSDLISFTLKENAKHLYDRLPMFDRDGDKVRIEYHVFSKFIDIVLLYMDFKQKEKFGKLKNLRKSQSLLPIADYRDEIIKAVKTERVVLIAGDTGCGKSTQVPQYIYKAGFKKIACTQPRRIACISLAKRVAHETLTEYGSEVGYQIRFEKSKRKDTSIIFITEGLLLRQASDEETILSYDVVILDEVHERHLHGDFLIGIMKCLLYKRDDFKLILMSATINIKLFSDYFSEENIKVIQVPGRLYPIDIIYKPIIKDRFEKKAKKFDSTPYLQIIQIIDEKYPKNERGDLLIFLCGIADITTLSEDIAEYNKEKQSWIILQLHSSLALAEQDKVFDYPPEGVRKCIISTNIAETSVTIDGVRFVIDSGKVNRMSYNTSGGINTLTELYISQDSAKQRSGRAGRTGPGICYRLYSEEEFNQFEPFTVAEIHLVPLESLILQMVSLGLNDILNFPFLERPNTETINNGIEKLCYYGALATEEGLRLTSLGEALGKLPVDLCIGKMLITSTIFGNVTAVLCLAAVVSVQSPYTNRAYRDLECQNNRRELESNHGDPMTLFNLFKEWLFIKQNSKPFESSSSKEKTENSRHWTKKRGLEEQRFYEVMKLMSQFRDILEDSSLLNKNIGSNLTSSERSIRYGELKKLKSARYELKNEMRSSQRKRLKYKMPGNEDDDDQYSSKSDIRDIEFRISNDYGTIQKLLTETCIENYKVMTLLKLVLCGGLYPQIAVGDEYNYCKSSSEQLFHTKHKNFISLHPMSYFGNNTDVLKLSDDDIEVPPAGYFSKSPISSRHQILIYQSLLETTKVYLMNTMRMPALQTLLLFSKTIATNETLTKIAFDDFLIVDLPHFGQGKTLLLKAVKLRNRWNKHLNEKLQGNIPPDECEAISSYLIDSFAHFMNTRASYSIKRLLKADLKTIYRFTNNEDISFDVGNPFDSNYKITKDYKLGGFKVSDSVTYNCLVEDEWSMNLAQQVSDEPFCCPNCDNSIYGSFLTQLAHEEFCTKKTEEEPLVPIDTKPKLKHNSQEFLCSVCEKKMYLTPVEQLQHKKKCVKM